MFKLFKDKLKKAVSEFSEKIDKEGQEEIIENKKETSSESEILEDIETKKPEDEKKGFFGKLRQKILGKHEIEDIPETEFEEIPIENIEKGIEEEKIREKTEKEKQEIDSKIKEKLKKEETPSLQDLAERKKKEEIIEEKTVEKKTEEKKPEQESEEIKPEKKPKPAIIPVITKAEEKEHETKDAEPEEKGFFGKLREKIVTKKINEKQFDDIFWNLEIILLENNVAVEVIDKIKNDLKEKIVDKPIRRGAISKTIHDSLKQTIAGLFDVETFDFIKKIKTKKPFVICFVGINGSGKTTTIAKVVKLLQKNKLSCVLAASDTFRAAAIDQLQIHADKLGIKLIKHDYGSDAAAVAFDAIKHAESKGIDVVLIDTAGRIHSNINLMDEMNKIIRVAKPDMKIFVGESITGNDCTEQAKKFNETISIDGIILSKADVDEKGGAAISVSYVTGRPILFLGTGQEYDDLEEFDSETVIKNLGL